MQYVNGTLALVFGGLGLLHLELKDPAIWPGLYGAGAMLAATSCKPQLTPWTVRVLATTATFTMFIYFAGFFFCAPYLTEGWYAREGHGGTLALLIAGFCMMPVVSGYSCRMKAVPSTP